MNRERANANVQIGALKLGQESETKELVSYSTLTNKGSLVVDKDKEKDRCSGFDNFSGKEPMNSKEFVKRASVAKKKTQMANVKVPKDCGEDEWDEEDFESGLQTSGLRTLDVSEKNVRNGKKEDGVVKKSGFKDE